MLTLSPAVRIYLATGATDLRSILNDAEEIGAICCRERHRQPIPILNLPLPSPPPVGWEWIEPYRYWVRAGR
jgi:hypothetical protein